MDARTDKAISQTVVRSKTTEENIVAAMYGCIALTLSLPKVNFTEPRKRLNPDLSNET